MNLSLKPGVRLRDLQPQTLLALMIVQARFAENNASCVVTSVNDSVHSRKSLHYRGCAFDVRTKNLVLNKAVLVEEIKKDLGEEFDVVLESLGEPQEHLHVEWDPD